jgi:hypothetical protein
MRALLQQLLAPLPLPLPPPARGGIRGGGSVRSRRRGGSVRSRRNGGCELPHHGKELIHCVRRQRYARGNQCTRRGGARRTVFALRVIPLGRGALALGLACDRSVLALTCSCFVRAQLRQESPIVGRRGPTPRSPLSPCQLELHGQLRVFQSHVLIKHLHNGVGLLVTRNGHVHCTRSLAAR